MRAYDVPSSSPVQRPDGGSPLSVRHVIIENKEGYPSFANGIHQNTRSLVTEQTLSGEASRILFLSRDPNGMTVPAGSGVTSSWVGGRFSGGNSNDLMDMNGRGKVCTCQQARRGTEQASECC